MDGGLGRVADRFRGKVIATETCDWWVGAIGDDGYGRFYVDGRVVRASRFAWELANGPVPPGMVVMHRCDETLCVCEADLMLGTQAQNLEMMARRGRSAGRAHTGSADRRHAVGRARAIRAALLAGLRGPELAAVMAAGEPWPDQLALFGAG